MVLPRPEHDEKEDDFVNRFMTDKQAKEEFPSEFQRLSEAMRSYKKNEQGSCDSDRTSVTSQPDMSDVQFERTSEVLKVDQRHGLVFGFAMISKVDGEDYFDSQGDHIPEDAMMKASLDFMKSSRVAKEMHRGDQIGEILYAFPLTEDIAKSLGIMTRRTGLLIGMKPSKEVLAKFENGSYTGFSIGGTYVESEPA